MDFINFLESGFNLNYLLISMKKYGEFMKPESNFVLSIIPVVE